MFWNFLSKQVSVIPRYTKKSFGRKGKENFRHYCSWKYFKSHYRAIPFNGKLSCGRHKLASTRFGKFQAISPASMAITQILLQFLRRCGELSLFCFKRGEEIVRVVLWSLHLVWGFFLTSRHWIINTKASLNIWFYTLSKKFPAPPLAAPHPLSCVHWSPHFFSLSNLLKNHVKELTSRARSARMPLRNMQGI